MDLRAVIFLPAFAGAAILVFVFVTFAAHYYLTILESTATGAKPVTWMQESLPDKFWKPFYLGGLLVLWLGPAYVIGRTLAAKFGVPQLTFAVPLGVAWLLYPVSQLSSLAAKSVWVPLHPQVFARLAQRPGTAVGFFLLSLPVFALGGIAFRWAFMTKGEWELLFAGVPLFALALFVYARLLGRLAFALVFTRDLFKKRRRKKDAEAKAPVARERTPEDDAEPAVYVQPSELPPINTPDGELAGYNVLMADDEPRKPKKRVVAELADEGDEPEPAAPAPPPSKRNTWDDEEVTAYMLTEPEAPPAPEPAPPKPEPRRKRKGKGTTDEELSPAVKEELALLERGDLRKPPARVWSPSDLFAYFAQPQTFGALAALLVMGVLAGVMVRVAREFNPTESG
jgi:hypothetical protein